MLDKSLDNLSREELLELAQAQQQQIDALQQQLAAAQTIPLRQAASELRGLFESAHRAADSYLESAVAMQARQEDESARQLAQTEELCRRMLAQAEESAAYYWDALQQKVEEFFTSRAELTQPQPTEDTAAAEECFGPDD